MDRLEGLVAIEILCRLSRVIAPVVCLVVRVVGVVGIGVTVAGVAGSEINMVVGILGGILGGVIEVIVAGSVVVVVISGVTAQRKKDILRQLGSLAFPRAVCCACSGWC